jgi:hypothetical protein
MAYKITFRFFLKVNKIIVESNNVQIQLALEIPTEELLDNPQSYFMATINTRLKLQIWWPQVAFAGGQRLFTNFKTW